MPAVSPLPPPNPPEFQWTDLLAAEFAGRVSQLLNERDLPALLQKFKEEKTKRDWEVLKLRIGNTDHIVDADKSDGSAREYHIHSVKRLSDSEVFSIGDEVVFDGNMPHPFLIGGFDAEGKDMMARVDKTGSRYNVLFLQKVVKPKPLFNWVVFTEDGFGFPTWKEVDWCGDKGENWNESVKTFELIEDAKAFILLNQPLLSLKEVHEAIYLGYNTTLDKAFDNAKKIAKEKLSKEID